MAFYNRHKETQEILSCINDQENRNKIILLVGKTGVGKSSLVKMLLDTKLCGQPSVQVHVSKSSSDTIENLYYINALYRAFVQLAEENFFDDIPTPSQQGMLSLSNLVHFGAKVFWAKTIGSENRLYEPVDEGSVIKKRDYIIALLKKKSCIVNIDNAQNIDSHSFEVLKNIIQQVEHSRFILEYTIGESHSLEQFYAFYNELQQFNAKTQAFQIEKLDFEEAKKVAPDDVPEDRLRTIYQKSDGNLVPMMLSNSIMSELDDPIRFQLSRTTQNQRFIINLIFLNGGRIDFSLLYTILLDGKTAPLFSDFIIEETIGQLKDEKILEYAEGCASYTLHDSIINELEQQPANPALFLAFRALKEYYFNRLKNCPDESTIEHLFSLFLRFSDEDILALFPYIRHLIISYKYARPMIAKLTQFREQLAQKGVRNYSILYEFSLSLAALCVELGFAEEAQNNLSLIYDGGNAYHRSLQVAIYTLNFSDYTSLKEAEKLVQAAQSPREQLTMKLFLLSASMATLVLDKSLAMTRELLSTPEYSQLFEYAYLLRDYAELIPDYDESLKIYDEVIKRFSENGRKDLLGQIYVAQSMFNAYKGNLSDARALLEKAKESGGVPQHYLLNNEAVICILEKHHTARTADQLHDALLITRDPYEQCIVKSNLLVCYTLLHDQTNADLICEELREEDYESFSYEEFLHIIYTNMFFYYHAFGDETHACQFQSKLIDLLQRASPNSMTYRLASFQLNEEISQTEFYSNFPFRVDFLGNWSLEVSRDLERYPLKT